MKRSILIAAAVTVFWMFLGTVLLGKADAISRLSPQRVLPAVENLANGDRKYNLVTMPGADNMQIVPDDFYSTILEPGFPVQTYHGPGTFHGGQAINTLVADIGGGREEEIIVTGLSTGPLYAYNYLGNLLTGWPVQTSDSGADYAVYGNGVIAFANYGVSYLKGVDYSGTQLWEREADNYVSTPGSAAYSVLHGAWGFYIGEENGRMNGYGIASGSVLAGWPSYYLWGGQERHSPAIYDIDGDGELENISVSGTSNGAVNVTALNQNASVLWNYEIPKGEVDTYPVVGDIDGDSQVEIVVMGSASAYPWYQVMYVFNTSGSVERTWTLNDSTGWGSAPALADMNGDDIPEIVVQTDQYVFVTDGFGNALPGWPYAVGSYFELGDSSPVVGDVDGDFLPEVVFTIFDWYHTGNPAYITVLNHDGTAADAGFPLRLDYVGRGAVPALVDIDLDCHNEIIITGNYWDGHSGYYPKVWAFDLAHLIEEDPGITKYGVYPHGDVEWEQFMSNENHTGVYSPKRMVCIHEAGVE